MIAKYFVGTIFAALVSGQKPRIAFNWLVVCRWFGSKVSSPASACTCHRRLELDSTTGERDNPRAPRSGKIAVLAESDFTLMTATRTYPKLGNRQGSGYDTSTTFSKLASNKGLQI